MARRPSAAADGVVVAAVAPHTAAARAGLRPGDRILAINGAPLRDVIDFHFHAGEETLDLALDREGRTTAAQLTRRGPTLGLELAPPRPAEIATCANKCVFCFIHQLPKGMRKSLYVKDDDFRLSFLHGNYITLTDLEEAELARIESQRLSPLYVSVHATDPDLRHALLGQPRVRRELLPVMERLAKAGIAMHAQIVLCPGWNDGAHLERTVHELARLHPAVPTTAVVPVGLTRHRERLPDLRAVTAEEAVTLVRAVEGWQRAFQATLGTRFVWAADELYLSAGLPLPPAPLSRPRRATVVTGELFAPRMRALLDRLALPGLTVDLVPIRNEFFGRGIGVAGLLTGRDIQLQLGEVGCGGRGLGDEVLVPAVTLRDGAGVFLDDLTPADLGAALGAPVTAVEPTAPAFLAALLGR